MEIFPSKLSILEMMFCYSVMQFFLPLSDIRSFYKRPLGSCPAFAFCLLNMNVDSLVDGRPGLPHKSFLTFQGVAVLS